MNLIIEKFNELRKSNKNNIELEIRLKNLEKTSFEKYLSLFGDLKNNAILEQSINFISSDILMSSNVNSSRDKNMINKHNIRKMIVKDGIPDKTKNEYYQKTKIKSMKDYINGEQFSLSLSTEEIINKLEFHPTLIRFKNRLSITIDECWRADFTIIKTMAELTPELSNLAKIFFKIDKSGSKFDMIDFIVNNVDGEDKTISYELEFEYTNCDGILTKENIIKSICKFIPQKSKDNSLFQDTIYEIAKIILDGNKLHIKSDDFKSKFRLKSLLNNVIELNKNEYVKIYPPEGFLLTDKADGITCLIFIKNGVCKLLYGDKIDEYPILGFSGTAIIVAEYILDDNQLLVFDVLIYSDSNIIDNNNKLFLKRIEDRLQYLDKCANILTVGINIKSYAKEFIKLERLNLNGMITDMYKKKRSYNIDGLIFSECGKSYYETRNLKWKETPTIDFLCMKCPDILLNKMPFNVKDNKTLYLLFNGITSDMMDKLGIKFLYGYKDIFNKSLFNKNNENYFPIQFSPSSHPYAYLYYIDVTLEKEICEKYNIDSLNEQFVELSYKDKEWEFINIRDDRKNEYNYIGNNFKIAESTWLNMIDPFKLEDLWTVKSGYFAKEKDSIYYAQVGFNSFVKSQLINNIRDSEWVIDIASGKGQDLFRYHKSGIKNILFIDNDKIALAELITRKYELQKSGETYSPFSIYVLHADITNPYKETIEKIKSFPIKYCGDTTKTICANNVVCNFALHYFIKSKTTMGNFIFLVKSMLGYVVGGGKKKKIISERKSFTYTCFNGLKIFELLKNIKVNECWENYQDNIVKYSIKKLYDKNIFDLGLKIGVFLPFSDGEYYEEYLVNIDLVNSEFVRKGFSIKKTGSFSEYLESFQNEKPNIFKKINEIDLKYIDLLQYTVLEID